MGDAVQAAIVTGFTIWFDSFVIKWVAETVSGTPAHPPWWWSWVARSDFRFRWFWTVFGLIMLGLFVFTAIVEGQAALDSGQYVTLAIYAAQLVWLAYGLVSTVHGYF